MQYTEERINKLLARLQQQLEGRRLVHGRSFTFIVEPLGCYNSGLRVTLLCRTLPSAARGVYIVGPELRAAEVKHAPDLFTGKRIWRKGDNERQTVYVYRTRHSANERFMTLCDRLLHDNQQAEAKHRNALARANSKDPQEAMRGALDLQEF